MIYDEPESVCYEAKNIRVTEANGKFFLYVFDGKWEKVNQLGTLDHAKNYYRAEWRPL